MGWISPHCCFSTRGLIPPWGNPNHLYDFISYSMSMSSGLVLVLVNNQGMEFCSIGFSSKATRADVVRKLTPACKSVLRDFVFGRTELTYRAHPAYSHTHREDGAIAACGRTGLSPNLVSVDYDKTRLPQIFQVYACHISYFK